MNKKMLMIMTMAVSTGVFAQGRVLTGATPQRNAAAASEPAASGDKEAPALNWEQAPVDIVLQAYGDQLGKTVLKDPGTPNATISLKSREGQKLTQEEYLEAIEVVLEMNGVHVESYGEKFIRAIPRAKVRKDGVPLYMDISEVPEGYKDGRVISVRILLKNIGTEEVQKALEGFKSDSGLLQIFERTNSILVTDTWQNIQRMSEIVRSIDIATPVLENVFVRQIKNASASDIKTALEQIVQESQKQLEKEKGANNNVAQPNRPSATPLLGGGRLLTRNQPQPQPQPVNVESVVTSISDADRGMIRGKVLIIADERSNKLVIITQKSNMDFFDKVIDQLDVETTPDTVVKVYRLKYADSEDVSDMINDLIGNSSSSKSSGKSNQNQAAKTGTSGSVTRGNTTQARKPANQRGGDVKAGELNKDNTTVLADKRINGIVVMTDKELVPTIEQIIESMDIKLSQVLIETTIIEVTLGDGINTGMDWIQKGRQSVQVQAKDRLGQDLYYKTRTTEITDKDGNTRSTTSILSEMVPKGFANSRETTSSDGTVTKITEGVSDIAGTVASVNRSGVMNNWFGATSAALTGGGSSGQAAFGAISNAVGSAFGGSFNFIFNSDELGLAAILQATKTDSHSKYVASPIIMTLDNKEAVINATAMHYLLKGFTSSGNSYSTIAVPDYEQKELGIEIKTTPKINPNGTVMLTVEEKYTQLGTKEEIKYSSSNGQDGAGGLQSVMVPTTVTREMSSDVLLENGQTVVFGGLTEKSISESETGIPILKDIPIIGKWLFGKVDIQEGRTELLVFMTPYVLDEAHAAQAEALRRKKTLSDPRPWDDNGWSLSELADPVSKKEQMRRIKAEWEKQDEDRQTKIAIEKMKVDRARELQKMSKAERELWLKMHKKELDEEEQEELERKMLDKESQEELKKLAERVKRQKLADAEMEIGAAAAETAAENERSKLDAEKKAKGHE